MSVHEKGQPLNRFDVDTEFRFPHHGAPRGVEVQIDTDG